MQTKALEELINGDVLLIDDEEYVLQANARLLRRRGSTCFTATTYEEALRLLRFNARIALVILDWHMPGGPPSRFVESVKRDRPGLLIIGNSGTDHSRDFASLGVYRYLDKPWTIDQLIELLSQQPQPTCKL